MPRVGYEPITRGERGGKKGDNKAITIYIEREKSQTAFLPPLTYMLGKL